MSNKQNYCAPSRAKFRKCEILSVTSPIVACYLSLVTNLHIMALDRFVLPNICSDSRKNC